MKPQPVSNSGPHPQVPVGWAVGLTAASRLQRAAREWITAAFLVPLLLCGGEVVVLQEGFETRFPDDNDWSVGDRDPFEALAYWSDVDAAFGGEGTHSGDWKGYCAGIRYDGVASSPRYQNAMQAYLSRPISLLGYSTAKLSFWYKIPSIEVGVDVARVYVDSIDPVLVWSETRVVNAWTEATIDLSPYVGTTPTLRFEFVADPSITAEGWYLDDILVTATQSLANDRCSGAIPLQKCVVQVVSTLGATSVGDPTPACGRAFGNGVWFTYTSPVDGIVEISTCGSTFDTVLAIYSGTCRDLSPVACANDTGFQCRETRQETARFSARLGQNFFILAGGVEGATGELRIGVVDSVAPRLNCPPDLTLDADPGECVRQAVAWNVTTEDDCQEVKISCLPPSGSTFPLGATLVTCTAVDAAGNSSECHFTVTVLDREKPWISCPGNIALPADLGANSRSNVTYSATASDNCGSVRVSFEPPSGSSFPIGTTTVRCTATDAAGNREVCTFDVTITPAPVALGKEQRWANSAREFAVGTSAYRSLEQTMQAQGFTAMVSNAVVQWGGTFGTPQPRTAFQAVTIPFQSTSVPRSIAVIGVMLGMPQIEDGKQVVAPTVFGAVGLVHRATDPEPTLFRVLCDGEASCTTPVAMDGACLSAWFQRNWRHPTDPTISNVYGAMVGGIVTALEEHLDPGLTDPFRKRIAANRAGRWMGLFTFCCLGICLESPSAVDSPDAPNQRPVTEVRLTAPGVDGTASCCDWDPGTDALKNSISGFVEGVASGGGLIGGAIGAVTGGLKALFALNDDEAQWCAASGTDQTLEGVVQSVHFEGTWNPFTQDSLNWMIEVFPDYLSTPLNSQFNDGLQRCEWESQFVPDFVKAWRGDRVWMRGQLVFDCANQLELTLPSSQRIAGYRTQIHPPHALVVMREEGAVLLPETPEVPSTVARVYISPQGGEANHPDDISEIDGRVWGSDFDLQRTPYRFRVPLPPKRSGWLLPPPGNPTILVAITPESPLRSTTFVTTDSGMLRIVRTDASNADLQAVLSRLSVTAWPDSIRPTHLEIRLQLTNKITLVNPRMSPIAFRIATAWIDPPVFELDIAARMPVLDALTGLHGSPSSGKFIISETQPLTDGFAQRGWVPPDGRTILRITGYDAAWDVTALRVVPTQITVFEDHDGWARGEGEYRLWVGANGEWAPVPELWQRTVDDDDHRGLKVGLGQVSLRVRQTSPLLSGFSATGFEEDDMVTGAKPDDVLGGIEAPQLSLGTQHQSSKAGDYNLDYAVVTDETAVCQPGGLGPGVTPVVAPGFFAVSDLRLDASQREHAFVIQADDYMTLEAEFVSQPPSTRLPCYGYDVRIRTQRALFEPDEFDKLNGRRDSWERAPILDLLPPAFGKDDYHAKAWPIVADEVSLSLVVPNLNFDRPYPGEQPPTDIDYFKIRLPAMSAEQCAAPVGRPLTCHTTPAGLTIVLEGDRNHELRLLITNVDSGFAIDNDPATAIPDSDNSVIGSSAYIRPLNPGADSTNVILATIECPSANPRFSNRVVGLAVADARGLRNFYNLFITYNREAHSDCGRPLMSPAWLDVIRGGLMGAVDPVDLKELPLINYANLATQGSISAQGVEIGRGKVTGFLDLPADTTSARDDRWLILLPRASATVDIFVQPPASAENFAANIEVRDLEDQTVGRAVEVLDRTDADRLRSLRETVNSPSSRRLHFRAELPQLNGLPYAFKVDRTHFAANYTFDFTFHRSPELVATPATVSFGPRTMAWKGAPREVVLANAGNLESTIAEIALFGSGAGDFRVENLPDLPVKLAPGATLVLSVTFLPKPDKLSVAELRVRSISPFGADIAIGLSGSGRGVDSDPPTLSCPTNIVATSCDNVGRVVHYVVGVDDDGDTNTVLVCTPASGAFFPVGETWVNCLATDSTGKTNICRFLVTIVHDNQPPDIDCPVQRSVTQLEPDGSRVLYNVRATDKSGGPVEVTCTPASGSLFPLGSTTVVCIATDACGNRSRREFPVRVIESAAPSLHVTAEGQKLQLSWPLTASDYVLETLMGFNGQAVWTPADLEIRMTAHGFVALTEPRDRLGFYRLRRDP